MSLNRIWKGCVGLVVVVILASQFARAADCSSLVVGRKFAQQFGGFINVGVLLPNAGGGFWKFHSNGTVTGNATFTVGTLAQILDAPIKGTYELAWDNRSTPPVCSGTATINLGGMEQIFQLVVNENGNSIEFMHTDMGLATGFTAYAMHTDNCKKSMLAGTYTYNAKGWMLPPPPLEGSGFPLPKVSGMVPFNFSGAISFDGDGHFTGWDTVSLVGLVGSRTYTGDYKVGADCIATMTMFDSLGNPPINTEVFILKDAKGLQVINTDFGTVLAFTAQKAVAD